MLTLNAPKRASLLESYFLASSTEYACHDRRLGVLTSARTRERSPMIRGRVPQVKRRQAMEAFTSSRVLEITSPALVGPSGSPSPITGSATALKPLEASLLRSGVRYHG